jgi:ribonuclease-3
VPARHFVLGQLGDTLRLAAEESEPTDYKSSLQVLAQKRLGCVPRYQVLSQEGPEHEKRFLVEARLDGHLRSEGWGRSKKQAEQEAARQCWVLLQDYQPAESEARP